LLAVVIFFIKVAIKESYQLFFYYFFLFPFNLEENDFEFLADFNATLAEPYA